jgi:ferritin
MDLRENVATALQAQLTLERTNAGIYDALAAGLAYTFWPGSCAFMERAADEERGHAKLVRDYLVARNAAPVYEALEPAPLITADEPAPYFEAALEREHATTQAITLLHMQAWNEVDLETCTFLLPLFKEQTESTARIQDILKQFRRLDSDPLLVDQSLAEG